tara:strand:+ start:49824 stop:51248 length:1425 start_codon:yes stop_codon:yes gene_type:complete
MEKIGAGSFPKDSLEVLEDASAYAAEYIANVAHRRVSPDAAMMEGMQRFDSPMPERVGDPRETLRLLHKLGSPATMATTAGRFFGLAVGGTLPAAMGARVLSTAWDQIALNEATSPIGVQLEQVASKWLLDILQLPAESSVGFTTGATMANFTCLASARQAVLNKLGWDVSANGLFDAPHLRIVVSAQVHVTVLKALKLLGIGVDRIEYIPCDLQGRALADRLPDLDDHTIVILQAGNINSGASDPIGKIAEKCERAGAWVHVDGAFGLWAAASPKLRHQLDGYHIADSWVVDGHKWLNTPYDCGIAIVKSPNSLHAAMATQAAYIKEGNAVAPKDIVPEFSRSARGVEVWAAMHSLGKQGIADMLDRCCHLAQKFAEGLEKLGFEILNDVVLNQVVATLPEQENLCLDLAAHVQASGEAWFGTTHWNGKTAIRLSIVSWVTTSEDVTQALAAIEIGLDKLAMRGAVRASCSLD